MKTKYEIAIQNIDELNAKDPNIELHEGKEIPKELLYAQRMSNCLEDYLPSASEALKIAVRAQHIKRWEIPRSSFPEGRTGYLQWRTNLYKFHAKEVSKILKKLEYSTKEIEQITLLLKKKNLKNNPESQALEDVVCLVFLRYYLDDFAQKHPKDKIKHILFKTWNKMSEKAKKTSFNFIKSKLSQKLLQEISEEKKD